MDLQLSLERQVAALKSETARLLHENTFLRGCIEQYGSSSATEMMENQAFHQQHLNLSTVATC
jgi:hypothetical protein